MRTILRGILYVLGTLAGALAILLAMHYLFGSEVIRRYGGFVLVAIPLALAWGLIGRTFRMIWRHLRLDHAGAARLAESAPQPLLRSSRIALTYNKALFYTHAGDLEKARTELDLLRRESVPANLLPHVRFLDAFCLYFSGHDLQEARNLVSQAVSAQLEPTFPQLLLVLILWDQGDESTARQCLEQFQQRNTDYRKQKKISVGRLFVFFSERQATLLETFLLGLIHWKTGERDAARSLFSTLPVTGKPSFYQRKISELASS